MNDQKLFFDPRNRYVHLTVRKLLELTEQSLQKGSHNLFLNGISIQQFIIIGRVYKKIRNQEEGKVVFFVEDGTGTAKIQTFELETQWLNELIYDANTETRFIVNYIYDKRNPLYVSNLIEKVEEYNEITSHFLMCFIEEGEQINNEQREFEEEDPDAHWRQTEAEREEAMEAADRAADRLRATATPSNDDIAAVRSVIQLFTSGGGDIDNQAVIGNLRENMDADKVLSCIFILQQQNLIKINPQTGRLSIVLPNKK